jgi:hypothetical protein
VSRDECAHRRFTEAAAAAPQDPARFPPHHGGVADSQGQSQVEGRHTLAQGRPQAQAVHLGLGAGVVMSDATSDPLFRLTASVLLQELLFPWAPFVAHIEGEPERLREHLDDVAGVSDTAHRFIDLQRELLVVLRVLPGGADEGILGGQCSLQRRFLG